MSVDNAAMLERERVANTPKHWVRAVTACNSRCLFCLDSDTPRNLYLPVDAIKADIDRGRAELNAERVIISGGEATLHPAFPELVRYAIEQGYDRVQTVTNGYRFADAGFYRECVEAGLGEITFSLHGHTAELHDHLTGCPGAFARLIKGMVRAVRERRVIVNVDVVINKQNVAVLDKIVALCIQLGVTEFDLLHVIPQAAAFDNRDELFYDAREHLDVLHKVFRLNRHPRLVIWTNRFPVSYLEGLEDLIQDPHKMLDEINGRRFMVRSYLDSGKPLSCRDPERCKHCFIEPLCNSMDDFMERTSAADWKIWWVGDAGWNGEELPFGCDALGVRVQQMSDLHSMARPVAGLYIEVEAAESIDALPSDVPVTLVAERPEQLDAWVTAGLPLGVELEIRLNRATGPWLLAHREDIAALGDRVLVHQPGHEHLAEAREHDIRDPRGFFQALKQPSLRVSGLPQCLAPGVRHVDAPNRLDRTLFDHDTGRPVIRKLAQWHVSERYHAKSMRCDECALNTACAGAHINMIRDQGLRILTPIGPDTLAGPALERLANGRPPQPAPPSLPGHDSAPGPVTDPLAVFAKEKLERRAARHGRSRAPTETL